MPTGRRSFLTTGAALLGAAALHPVRALAAGDPPRSVSVRFNWTMKGEFTPFVVAREKGYYRAAGIDAQLNPGTSGTQAATSVAVGHDDFAVIPSVQLIEAITNDQMPLRAVAAIGNATGMCWGAHTDVPLTGPRSLEGRRVAISQSSTFFQLWDAFAKRFGVDQNKVQVVSADPSARIGLLLDGRVDVIADLFVANEFPLLQARLGSKLNLWRLAQVNFDPLGYLLVASTATIQRDPALVKAFTAATLRGMEYTAQHPDDAAAIVARTNDNLSAQVYRGQVAELITLMNVHPAPGKNQSAPWDRSLEILHSAGLIPRALDHDAYFTNAFV